MFASTRYEKVIFSPMQTCLSGQILPQEVDPGALALTDTIKITKGKYVGQAKSLNKTGHLP
jgi:hypothetical protein